MSGADIERGRAAAAERDLRRAINSIPGMVMVFADDFAPRFGNNQALAYFGIAQEQLGQWDRDAFTHPEDHAGIRQRGLQAMTTGIWAEHEVRLRRFDGVYRWFQSRGTPTRDASGRVSRWCNLLTDVTDIKLSESALKASEAEFRRAHQYLTVAQELSQTGSYMRNTVTDEQNLSDQMYRIWEFDPAKKVTQHMVEGRIHPADLPAFQDAWSRTLESGEDIKLSYRIVTDSGAVKHFRTISRRLEETADRLVYLGATQDITETRLAEETANRARAELAHVARASALGALTASIAHEINQPLAGIVTNASTCLRMLAADKPDLDRARATAERTIRDANRASEIVQRLRGLFARKQLSMEPLDLNDAAREVLALSSSELRRRHVAIHTNFADVPVVYGDRVQLQQVILNLVLNAADAMSSLHEPQRSLRVETRFDDLNGVCLSVRDSGVGFGPGESEKIFDAFYTTKIDGMGIGLSVSRSIIESHHGRISATANDGPGATFAFSIPAGPQV